MKDADESIHNQGGGRFEALITAVFKKKEMLSYKETEASHREFLDQIDTAKGHENT